MSKKLDEKIENLSEQEQKLLKLRHTAEHVLHTAMQKLYPNLKKAMGPATDDGFYFDFDLDEKITEDQFPAIEKEMARIIKSGSKMVRREIEADEAKKIFAGNPYKMEWIEDIAGRGEKFSTYQMTLPDGKVIDEDLCSGPHLDSVSEIGAFKLLSVAGAYWHGDEKNKMLTRIYATAFETREELDQHVLMIEEAKKRDHRKLGQDLGLFVFSETIGKGLPMWTPKGATVRRILEKFVVDEEIKRGYLHVYTPDIANLDLYKKSGHYPYYKDSMYAPIKIDEEEYMLRPMTCPHHFEFYLTEKHSYKELPMRIAELAKLYRYEKSGELSGLMRVRSFCLADAHIVCRENQVENEVHQVLDLIEYCAGVFGLKAGDNFRYRLSLGDRADDKKYYKDDGAWNNAEDVLRKVLIERNANYYEAEGEAAFYGPKIDIQMKNVAGKEDTAFTVQYDFVMPKRFGMTYVNEEGVEQEPVVVHRSSIGAIERLMAFLIEHYAGAFPVWLSPTQVAVLPISEKTIEYSKKVVEDLRGKGIRVDLYEEADSLGKKIRNAEASKVPYMLIVGEKEAQAGSVSVRMRGQKDLGVMSADAFVERVVREDDDRVVSE